MTVVSESEAIERLRAQLLALSPGARIAIAAQPPDYSKLAIVVWPADLPDGSRFDVETEPFNIQLEEGRKHLLQMFTRWLNNGGSYLPHDSEA